MKKHDNHSDLPQAQAGYAAALRRAFSAPTNDRADEFEALLNKIA